MSAVLDRSANSPRAVRTVPPESLGLKESSVTTPGYYSSGSRYHSSTHYCDFALDVKPEIAQVSLLIRRTEARGREQVAEIPMREVNGAWSSWGVNQQPIAAPRRWAISVKGVKQGEEYAFRLKGNGGEIIAEHASDPFAIASTPFSWNGEYLNRVRTKLEAIRQEGESDDALLRRLHRVHGSPYSESGELLLPRAGSGDFVAPWSIVIDPTKLLDPQKVNLQQPHGAGERIVIKYHPWHSRFVPDSFISDEFKSQRGFLECLRDERFTQYLARYGNTIEFFPLGQSVSEPAVAALGRNNVWGYMPAHVCGLNSEYFISKDPHDNLRTLQEIVCLLKQRGFSVICDMVSGHTAETGDIGPSFSLREIYPEAYFLMDSNGKDVDVTGCGNTLSPFSQVAVKLIEHQSDFLGRILGVDPRIDQAPTLGLKTRTGEGFDPYHETFKRITAKSRAPIVELSHAAGHYGRAVPDDGSGNAMQGPRVTAKDFWLRNFQYSVSHWEGSMWPQSNPRKYRAFIASGSCGGLHPLQQQFPWSRNHGIQVFPHDGETVFDRARWMAVKLLRNKLQSDPVFGELVEKINDSSGDYDPLYRESQERYALMSQAVEYLNKRHPDELRVAQGAAARWFLSQLYSTPGDILIVAGDHMGRSQQNNGDAYDSVQYIEEAMQPSKFTALNNIQLQSSFLTDRLRRVRERFPEIFKNTSVVDGNNPSSFDPALVLSLSWYNEQGISMEQGDWDRVDNGDVFLSWIWEAYPVQDTDRREPRTKLLFVDSSKESEFKLPDPGEGREWRTILDSTAPLLLDNNGYKNAHSHRLSTCGMIVMESVATQE